MPEFDSRLEYRDVVGFPGYKVGNDGSMWTAWEKIHPAGLHGTRSVIGCNWRRMAGAWVSKRRGKDTGYVKIYLHRNGRPHAVKIHSLVLRAFAGPRPDDEEARHLDDVKTNNRLDNLCWGTPRENAADRRRNGIPSGFPAQIKR